MKRIVLALMILILLKCSSKKKNDIGNYTDSNSYNKGVDSIDKRITKSFDTTSIASNDFHKYNKKDFVGIWAKDKKKGNASFVLGRDSMYYVEDLMNKYYYKIKNDTIIFYTDEEGIKLKIKEFKSDTLRLDNDGIIETYVKRR